jgi:two-component system phosphate regulon response regulator PhoB
VVSSGESAAGWARRSAPEKPDLFVLESRARAPGVGQAIAQLRTGDAPPGTPVIVVSERLDETQHLVAMAAGADDYLPMSLSARVVAAHCAAVLRRAGPRPAPQSGAVIQLGPVSVNTETHQTTVEHKPVRLTRSEFRLLCALIQGGGRVVSRRVLQSRCLDRESGSERVVDTHLTMLRRKLGAEGRRIVSVRGAGYRAEL